MGGLFEAEMFGMIGVRLLDLSVMRREVASTELGMRW